MPRIQGPVTRTDARRRQRTTYGATIDPRQPWVSSLARSETRAAAEPTVAQTGTAGGAGPTADRPVGEPDASESAAVTDESGTAPPPEREEGADLTPTFLDGSERVRLSWRHPESAGPPDLDGSPPRILVASVTGVRVHDDRRRVTVHVREVDHPGDGELLLVGDLAGDPAATTVFESGDHHVPESAARVLDRSTVVVESRSAGIGHMVVQWNTVLWTACRDADAAAALIGDHDLVQRLADLACDPGDPVVRQSFEHVLDVVPVSDVDGSDIRRGDVVRRPPGSGRTLRIRERTTAPASRRNRHISGRQHRLLT